MQKEIDVESQEQDATDKSDPVKDILKSNDLESGVRANIESVEISEYLVPRWKFKFDENNIEKSRGDYKIESDSAKIIPEDSETITEDDIDEALSSKFVNNTFYIDGKRVHHINEDYDSNKRVAIYLGDDEEGRATFSVCSVEHSLEVDVSNSWGTESLRRGYTSKQTAEAQAKKLEETSDLKLTYNRDRFKLYGVKERSIRDRLRSGYENMYTGPGMIAGMVFGLGIIGVHPFTIIFIVLSVLSVDYGTAYIKEDKGDKKSLRLKMENRDKENYTSLSNLDIDQMTNVQDSKTKVEIQGDEDKIVLTPKGESYPKWRIPKTKSGLIDDEYLKFFRESGMGRIDETGELPVRMINSYTAPRDTTSIKSECGEWYLVPDRIGD